MGVRGHFPCGGFTGPLNSIMMALPAFLLNSIRDVSFFLCVGGCNFSAEIVSKNFLSPPAEYTLKIPPLEERDAQSCLR